MALTLNNLRPAKGAKKSKKRLGRGDSSGSGSYSGRGMKGQRSRSGGKGGLKIKGLKTNIQSTPKLPGFKSLRPKFNVVNLKDIDKNFKTGDIITSIKLVEKGLVKRVKPGIKLLGTGSLKKKLTIKIERASDSAIVAIEKAGGQIILTNQKKKKEKAQANEKTAKEIKKSK